MNEIIFEVLKLIVMVMALLIARYLVPWAKQKMDNEEIRELMVWVEKAVLMAEQVHGDKTGAERKEIVIEFLKEILAEKDIQITEEQLDALIEAAVKAMNMADLSSSSAGTSKSPSKKKTSQKQAK